MQHQLQLLQQEYEQTRRRLERECEQTRQRLEHECEQTRQQLRQARENAPIGRQLKNLGVQLRSRREQGGNPVKWGVKYLVYLLCWVPEKMLSGMMFYLQNGAKQTIKKIFHK